MSYGNVGSKTLECRMCEKRFRSIPGSNEPSGASLPRATQYEIEITLNLAGFLQGATTMTDIEIVAPAPADVAVVLSAPGERRHRANRVWGRVPRAERLQGPRSSTTDRHPGHSTPCGAVGYDRALARP